MLFWCTPKGLFPTDDTGQLLVTTEAAEGVSYDALVQQQAEVAAVIKKDPDVRAVTSSVGTTAAANQGQLTIDLKPIDERKRSADQIARDLTAATAQREGHRDVHPESAGDLDRRPRDRRVSISTRCRAATSTR